MPLMRPSRSHVADANGITLPRQSHCIPFDHLDLTNGMVPLMTPWPWHKHQWHYMTQKLCCTSFWLAWLKKCSGASYDIIGITCYWFQCHHLTTNVMLLCHFANHDLTNGMVPLMTLLASCDTNIHGITWLKVMLHIVIWI